jgi:hypothetical protein
VENKLKGYNIANKRAMIALSRSPKTTVFQCYFSNELAENPVQLNFYFPFCY